jgi:hypothetical protein
MQAECGRRRRSRAPLLIVNFADQHLVWSSTAALPRTPKIPIVKIE